MQSNIVFELLSEYFELEKVSAISILVLSLLVNIIQANGISYINARIVEYIKSENRTKTMEYYNYFVMISFVFIILYFGYKYMQNRLLTKLRQWIRKRIVSQILEVNNENMGEINFVTLSTPIKRITLTIYILFSDIFSGLLPQISFITIVGLYLLYINPQIGFIYIFTNIIVAALLFNNWENMMKAHADYEKKETENESYLLEILSNVDRIVYRGQTKNESNIFSEKVDHVIEKAVEFYSNLDIYNGGLSMLTTGSVLFMIYRAISLFFAGKMSSVHFITLMTMVILYRDKMISLLQMVPDFVEFTGRVSVMLNRFDDMNLYADVSKPQTKPVDLTFNSITFHNVVFKYKAGKDRILDNLNLELDTSGGKIIGVTGISGRGKSTLMRILLKIYYPESGEVMIDGISIREIDADYLRKHIVYVTQTGKLFDRKVVDNLLYGCEHKEQCFKELDEIMKYPHIKAMFENVDIYNKQSGALGENLSGGQRQIINIVGGLINPSRILVLDEPTNALDGDLKKEVIALIKEYQKTKNAIIIITHDPALHELFTQTVNL